MKRGLIPCFLLMALLSACGGTVTPPAPTSLGAATVQGGQGLGLLGASTAPEVGVPGVTAPAAGLAPRSDVASSTALPAGTLVAGTVSCGADLLLYAPLNAPLEQRRRLLRVNRAAQTVVNIDLGLTATEGVTSLLCAQTGGVQTGGPADDLWMTVHSDGAQGSVIAHLLPDGHLRRFPVGAVADTLNTLTRTPDGRLWFLQYKQARLGEFDPATGLVRSHPVGEHASHLRLGQDGALYYSQFYTNPAVVRFDTVTGSSSVLAVGAKSLPRANVQTGGAVWFVDAWNQSLSRLDLLSRQVTQASLPAGAVPGELVAAPDGTLWVSDASRHVLYRLASGSLQAATVALPGAASDGPRALSIDDAGTLWYESAGQLVRQP
jgi:hypothetical protein